MRTTAQKLIFPLLFLLLTFLSFNKHSRDREGSYHGVIWADAAGYYSHLPRWFIYGNNPGAFPADIAARTGNGFYCDSISDRVVTKYPVGAALMETPFFLAAHFLAGPLGFQRDGFSSIYSYALYIAGVFYCCLGIWFLQKFLKLHFSSSIAVLTPLLFLVSTNLFYYSIDAPGMSHVYSFFLVCLFMYLIQRIVDSGKTGVLLPLLTGCFTLLVLTRPTNGIFILFPLFYQGGRFFSVLRSSHIFSLSFLSALLLPVIIAIPQILYWKYLSGSFVNYSYAGETFSNWKAPRLAELWFSPNNGLFLYAPLMLLCIAGLVSMIRSRNRLGWPILGIFLAISYIFASWWCWWFGCSLGSRSYVEFYPLMCIPLAFLLEKIMQKRLQLILTGIFVAFCIFIYFNIEYYYDGCFYGGTWDFQSYLKLLEL